MHNERFGRDDLAAWACIRLDRLNSGYRVLHLWDSQGVRTKAFLIVKIEYYWNTIGSKK